MKIPFVGQSYTTRSLAAAAQVSINVMPQTMDDPNEHGRNLAYAQDVTPGGGKNSAILVGCPGYHGIIQLPTSPVRGLWGGNGRCFAVAGNTLYEVGLGTYVQGNPSTGAGAILSSHALPGPGSDGNPVQMFGNGNQLLIVANGTAYIWNPPAAPIQILFEIQGNFTTADGTHLLWTSGDQFTAAMAGLVGIFNGVPATVSAFVDATHITLGASVGVQATPVPYSCPAGSAITAVTGAYLDDTFYVQRVAGGSPDLGRQVNFSAPGDGTTWDPLDFFSKEAYPDYISSLLVMNETLYVFGAQSGEIWQNSPVSGLPTRVPGGAQRLGSLGHWGPVTVGGSVFFIGGDPSGNYVAYTLNGFTPVRISTHAIEAQWATTVQSTWTPVSYGTIEDGHVLWVINFASLPGGGGGATYVYDLTAGEWHQRAFCTVSGGAVTGFGPYLCQYHTWIGGWGNNGMHIAGDPTSGWIFEMNMQYADQNGSLSGWRRVIPYAYAGRKRIYFGRMDLEMDVSLSGSISITRDYSDDQGLSYVNPQLGMLFGVGNADVGNRGLYWPTSGSSYERLWRFTGVAQGLTTLIDLECDIEQGIV